MSENSEQPDPAGDQRLASVADRIGEARAAARDLADHDAIDPDAVQPHSEDAAVEAPGVEGDAR